MVRQDNNSFIITVLAVLLVVAIVIIVVIVWNKSNSTPVAPIHRSPPAQREGDSQQGPPREQQQPPQQQKIGALVLYFMNGCGPCAQLKPNWNQAIQIVRQKYPMIDVFEFEATKDADRIGQDQVRGFPTVRFYTAGQMHEYKGDRSAQSIVQFVESFLRGPPPQQQGPSPSPHQPSPRPMT